MKDSDYSGDDNADIRKCKFAFKCEKRCVAIRYESGSSDKGPYIVGMLAGPDYDVSS